MFCSQHLILGLEFDLVGLAVLPLGGSVVLLVVLCVRAGVVHRGEGDPGDVCVRAGVAHLGVWGAGEVGDVGKELSR